MLLSPVCKVGMECSGQMTGIQLRIVNSTSVWSKDITLGKLQVGLYHLVVISEMPVLSQQLFVDLGASCGADLEKIRTISAKQYFRDSN